jgi:hypothetical protein
MMLVGYATMSSSILNLAIRATGTISKGKFTIAIAMPSRHDDSITMIRWFTC